MAGKRGGKRPVDSSPSKGKTATNPKRRHKSSDAPSVPNRYILIDWDYTPSNSTILRALRVYNFSPGDLSDNMAATLEALDPCYVMRGEFSILSDHDLVRPYFSSSGLQPPSGFLGRQN
jgi:hypothetical protein